MKITRLRVSHYRGITSREIAFAPRGVTIAVGPNEVGKSSLAESLELLFDERDDTAKQRVREVQPVDRDEASEVEADVEIGPYVFCYAKRFHRRPATRLRVSAPRVENLTGREAHERVRSILEENLDVALWRALRLAQDEPLAQPRLGSAPSLLVALDRAAGVRGGGEGTETLFDAARGAYEEHFTATGRPRRELASAEHELAGARAEEEAARAALDALEYDVDTESALRRQVADLEASVAAGRAALAGAEAELEAVRALRIQASQLAANRDLAHAAEDLAVQRARQRGQLAAAFAGAAAELESLSEAFESEEPAHIAAAAELRHVEERLAAARTERVAASGALQRARSDAAFRRDEREAVLLAGRAARIAREREEAARAREVLAGPPLDEARVGEIQAAQLEAERAQTRLAAEGPTVAFVPEIDVELVVDGRRERVRAGEPVERRVAEALVLSLPGVAEITVVAGAAMAERRKRLEQATTRQRALCLESGVDDHAGAVAALAARRAAQAELARSEQRLALALDGEEPDALAQRLRDLEARIGRRAAERAGAAPLPETLEAADAALEAAEAVAARARESAEDWARRRDQTAQRFEQFDRRLSDTRTRIELTLQSRSDLGQRLAAARAESCDEALEESRAARADAARECEARALEAERELAEREPEKLEERAARRRSALDADERALREQRDTLLRLLERLDNAGSEGRFERCQLAQARRERAERELAARHRRAGAARRLFEVLREEREACRSHYAVPLAEAIAALGKPVFGADFEVELGPDLRVARRILGGTSLAESQLSAGAREQLALLARLAAARLAGGVPLWLDDALGHSDPERLAALGPLLAAAGEHTQVIVLTCSPERFAHVPGARIVELR